MCARAASNEIYGLKKKKKIKNKITADSHGTLPPLPPPPHQLVPNKYFIALFSSWRHNSCVHAFVSHTIFALLIFSIGMNGRTEAKKKPCCHRIWNMQIYQDQNEYLYAGIMLQQHNVILYHNGFFFFCIFFTSSAPYSLAFFFFSSGAFHWVTGQNTKKKNTHTQELAEYFWWVQRFGIIFYLARFECWTEFRIPLISFSFSLPIYLVLVIAQYLTGKRTQSLASSYRIISCILWIIVPLSSDNLLAVTR